MSIFTLTKSAHMKNPFFGFGMSLSLSAISLMCKTSEEKKKKKPQQPPRFPGLELSLCKH